MTKRIAHVVGRNMKLTTIITIIIVGIVGRNLAGKAPGMTYEEKLEKAAEAMQEIGKQCGLMMSREVKTFNNMVNALDKNINKVWYEIELKNIKHNPNLNRFQRLARIRQLKRAAQKGGIILNDKS